MSRLQQRVDDLRSAFRVDHGGDPDLIVRAPGRVSVLGGHVDYNEGWVMPAAIDRSILLAARRRPDRRLRARSLLMGEVEEATLDPVAPPLSQRPGARRSTWLDYALGVAWVLEERGLVLDGLDATLTSDLPTGAGVSSSAALEVAFLLAWTELAGRRFERMELASLGRRVENEYLSIGSGIQDQFASLCGRTNHVLVLDCRSGEWESLPLPRDIVVLVADSGVRRRLQEGGLNDRRGECARALGELRRRGLEIEALRDLALADLDEVDALLEPMLARRARHVAEECDRVRRGAESLGGGALDEFGALMLASHRSSRDLYEVSIPELDQLVCSMTRVEGCIGARLSGAGFGGCVVALCRSTAEDEVRTRAESEFSAQFGRSPEIFACRLADGAARLAADGAETAAEN